MSPLPPVIVELTTLFAWYGVVANLVTFPGRKEGERLKIQVNRCIREQKNISIAGMSKMQTYLYKLIMHIKELLMENMEADELCKCYFERGRM